MGDLAKCEVEAMGYRNVRQLPDGTWAGTIELLYTRAVCTGITELSYAYRWCFEDKQRAIDELNKMQAMDDQLQGWVARR